MQLKQGKRAGDDGILEYLKLGVEEQVPSIIFLFNITLLPNLYKLFLKVQKRKLTRILNKNQPPAHAGFHSGFSVTDQVTEKAQDFHLKIYMALIDTERLLTMGSRSLFY
jgi:hypothetical protein